MQEASHRTSANQTETASRVTNRGSRCNPWMFTRARMAPASHRRLAPRNRPALARTGCESKRGNDTAADLAVGGRTPYP